MKKTIQLILCLSLPMMAMACGKGNPTSASLTTAEAMVSNTGDDSGECLTIFSHINREDVVHYQVTDPDMNIEGQDGFYARAACSLAWPKTVMGRSSARLQQALIDKIVGEPEKFKSLEDALRHEMDATNYIPFEKSDIKDVKHIKKIPDDAGMNQAYYDVQLTPMKMDKNLCVFMFAKDSYMGGAHGIYWTEYVTYDVVKDKVVQLNDLVTDTVKLSEVITKALFDQEGVNNMAALNDKGFLLDDVKWVPITQNIYVEDFSIHFVYHPYEIACYARGQVDVEVEPYRLDEAGIQSKYLQDLIDRYTR